MSYIQFAGLGWGLTNFYSKETRIVAKKLRCENFKCQLNKEVCNGGVACSLSPQARKSGKNCCSFSIPLWFALKQSFFCRKNHTRWHFAFVGDCPFFYMKKTKKNLWCQIDFLIICSFFCSYHFLIRCETKIRLWGSYLGCVHCKSHNL